MSELEETEGRDSEVFESWDSEMTVIALLGDKSWPEQARIEVDKVENICEPHMATSERAIGLRKLL